jgi:hypothetical protein
MNIAEVVRELKSEFVRMCEEEWSRQICLAETLRCIYYERVPARHHPAVRSQPGNASQEVEFKTEFETMLTSNAIPFDDFVWQD